MMEILLTQLIVKQIVQAQHLDTLALVDLLQLQELVLKFVEMGL